MLEYAERRGALGCGSRSSRKRRRPFNGAFADGESAVQLVVDQEDEELCDTRIMVFGTDSSWPEIGYVQSLFMKSSGMYSNNRGFVLKIQVPPRCPQGHPVPPVATGRPPIETKEACCHSQQLSVLNAPDR